MPATNKKQAEIAERGREYWTTGAGGIKIRWGQPGDFSRCVRLIREHTPMTDPEGYCATLHVRATGARPGHAASEQRGKHS
jgi:hypothetical protein